MSSSGGVEKKKMNEGIFHNAIKQMSFVPIE